MRQSRVKLVAAWSLANDAAVWEYAIEPDFPALAEQLLAAAVAPDESLRCVTLGLLAKTLPITKIDLGDLTTDERREAVRRLAQAIPRDEVQRILCDAASDKHIAVILTAAQLLLSEPENPLESRLADQLADVLQQVIEGKYHDAMATKTQRGQALASLCKLRGKAAPAVSLLIKLLKSGEVEFADDDAKGRRGAASTRGFTRDAVILTLAAIGPPAKDALPILEAELELLEKKVKENALLSGDSKSRTPRAIGGTTASLLQWAIRAIWGEVPDGFFRHRT